MEHESDDYTNLNWCSWYNHQRIGSRIGRLGNNRTGGDCPNYSIVEIGQNTEKSPGDLRRLVVAQTPVRNHQLMLVWKTLKWEQIIIVAIIKVIMIKLIVKLVTLVEGDPKAPFSIATTSRCRGGCYSFLWIALLYLDPYLIMLSVKQGGIKYHFLSLWYESIQIE